MNKATEHSWSRRDITPACGGQAHLIKRVRHPLLCGYAWCRRCGMERIWGLGGRQYRASDTWERGTRKVPPCRRGEPEI